MLITPTLALRAMALPSPVSSAGTLRLCRGPLLLRVILFDLQGEEPSQWTLAIQDGVATMEEGATKTPKLTISGNSEHLVQMFTGEIPPMKLVNAKLVKMKGPMMDAIAFSGLWNIPKK